MPDSKFTEVLELKIETDKFAKEMDEVARIYKDKLKDLPKMGDIGSGGSSDKSVKELSSKFEQFSKSLGSVLADMNVVFQKIEDNSKKTADGISKVTDQTKKLGEETKKAGEETKKTSDIHSSWIDNLLGSMPKAIASVIRFKLAWETVKIGIDLLKAPFDFLKEGFEYLEKFEERANRNGTGQLAANLLQNIQFAKDWKDNVKLAGEASENLIVKIDVLAAKMKTKSEVIQAAFQSFLSFGGRSLVKNLDEALNVAATATAALQITNPQLSTRKVVSEIQDLAQGAVKDGSKLAATLGLSASALNEMVVHARKFNDLNSEIIVHSKGIQQYLADSGNKMVTLSALVDVYRKRWEAVIIGPMFDRFVKILSEVAVWLDKHEDVLERIGKIWGEILDAGVEYIENFAKTNWSELSEFFVTIAKMAVVTATAMGNIVNGIITSVNLAKDAYSNYSQTLDLEKKRRDEEEAARQAFQDNKINYAELNRRTEQSKSDYNTSKTKLDETTDARQEQHLGANQNNADALELLLGKALNAFDSKSGANPINAPAPNGTDISGDHTKDAEHKAALQKDRDELTKGIDELKGKYEELRSVTQDALAARTIDHKEAAVQIRASYEQEFADVKKLVDAYKALVSASGAKGKDKAHADAYADDLLTRFKNTANKASNEADKLAIAEDVATQKEHNASILRISEEHQKALLALTQEYHARGFLTDTELLHQETEVLKQEHENRVNLLRQEIIERPADAKKINDKIAEEESKFTDQMVLYSEKRAQAVENERRKKFQYQQDLRDAQAERLIIENETQNVASGGKVPSRIERENTAEVLKLRRQQIDLAIEEKAAELEVARAKNADSDATRKLIIELQNLENKRRTNTKEQIQNSISGVENPVYQKAIVGGELQKQVDEAKQALATATLVLQDYIKNGGDNAKVIAEMTAKVTAANDAVDGFTKALSDFHDSTGDSFGKAGQSAQDSLLGKGFSDAWDNADGGIEKLGVAAQGAAHALGTIQGVISQYKQGAAQGGVLGGIGSLLSSGPVSDALSAIPYVGAFVKPIGAIFSLIGGFLTAAARRIANQIKTEIDKINTEYQAGRTTLKQTIDSLEAERVDAIARLSGKKGGKTELDKLLPEIDKEIDSLKKQQKQVIDNFNDNLAVLRLQSDELGKALKTWQDINKTVKEYVDAGGDAAKAAEFLQLNLAKLRQDTIDSLEQGEQTAIQDAIHLNDLLKQRVQLIKEFKQQEFDLINGDAIERRVSNAVSVGQKLTQLRADHKEQLDALDQEIDLTSKKVEKEKEVFTISSDINDLHRRDEELTLLALDQQIKKWKDMQTIINGIVNENGVWKITDTLQKLLGIFITAVTGTGTGTGGGGGILGLGGGGGGGLHLGLGDYYPFVSGAQSAGSSSVDSSVNIQSLTIQVSSSTPINGATLANEFQDELQRRMRYGMSPYGN